MVVAIILGLSTILFATRTYISEVDKNSTLLISMSQGLPSRSSGTTGTPKQPTNTTQHNSNPTGVLDTHIVTPQTSADYIVSYTNTGFSPQKITIKAGQTVRFLNASGAHSLWIAAAAGPTNFPLTEFNQGKSVGKGGTYNYTFSRKGNYVYYNNNNKNDVGLITVQ